MKIIASSSIFASVLFAAVLFVLMPNKAHADDHYFFTDSNHSYSLFTSPCGAKCSSFGMYCGRKFYATKATRRVAVGKWKRNETVQILKNRGAPAVVCKIKPQA